jgi:hypothetical protein
LDPHTIISTKVNEDVLKGIFQLEGMVIDEHQALKKALQDLLDIKKFHTKEHGIVNNYAQRQLIFDPMKVWHFNYMST